MNDMATQNRISAFFEQDHREIDGILEKADYGSPKKAVEAFEEFDRRLERHIGWEEDLLFPAAAAINPGLEHGPLYVMREEHKLIREEKAQALEALRSGDGSKAKSHAGRMTDILIQHNIKEERILYPACDGLISPAERERILREVRKP